MSGTRTSLLPCAGLVLGPVAWAANTQISQFLPFAECRAHIALLMPLTAACMVCSLGGAFISLRQWLAVGRSPARKRSAYPTSYEFVCAVGALTGTMVGFALLLQGIASITVPPCLR
jgi:hypothetical protein